MSRQNFVGYEYQDVTAKRNMAAMYADGYENFGWQLESSDGHLGAVDTVTLKFKRDRKIRNKAELSRLQRNFDACVREIETLESSKYIKASIAAYIIGILGTAFMAGSVFAVTANMIVPCIILAIPAFIGWVLPYFIYKKILKAKTGKVTPLINQKYDEMYTVCEKANGLLDQVG